MIRIAVGASRGRVPVIAGAGSNATAHAIELSKVAEANGADASLSVVRDYNKPTQEGLHAHYCEVAASTGLPIILYDVPSRTGRGLADETVARLAEVPQIIGLKDAAGDITRPARLRALLGSDFRLFCGDDAVALAYFAEGGDGCISVTSNVAPALCRSMFLAWKHGQIARARRLAASIAQLTTALFRETNPVPIKYALSLFDLASAWYTKQGGTSQRPGAAVRRIFGVYDRKDRRICPRRPPRCGGVGAEFLNDDFALHSHDQTYRISYICRLYKKGPSSISNSYVVGSTFRQLGSFIWIDRHD